MTTEPRTCQNCKSQFEIQSEDIDFYKRIDVPHPTWCPQCRHMRRFVWRNERILYKRNCDATGNGILTMFRPDSPYVVYEPEYWWSDKWDASSYGQDYDFSRSFFEQYDELYKKVPQLSLFNTHMTDSEYTNYGSYNKECYLFTAGGLNERVMFSNRCNESKDCLDMYIGEKNEKCYECIHCSNSYKLFFSQNSDSCADSFFLFDCKNCSNCFGCSNLRNKSYCIFNKQYTKEAYQEELKNIRTGSYASLQKLLDKYKEISKGALHKFSVTINALNVSGNNIRNAKNCHECFDMGGDKNENCKFVVWGGFKEQDSYDTGPGAGWGAELIYETMDTFNVSNLKCCMTVHESRDCSYSINCHSSNNLFGCVGLRNKSYCILNKQYSKEEYENLLPKIKKHMQDMPYIGQNSRTYTFGDFFPMEMSPFAHNETIAQEYFPTSKESGFHDSYRWKDPETKQYKSTMQATDIPDDIAEVNDDILNQIISCEHNGSCEEQCTTAFRIIPQELQFYRQIGLPLPHLCPNCRHYRRLKQTNPLKLWGRKCQCKGQKSENDLYANIARNHKPHGLNESCPNKLKTSYSPDRPEIVYCEQCYQAEVV